MVLDRSLILGGETVKKIYKFLLIVFLFLIFIPKSSLNVFAGNNDSLPSYGYSGKGDDKWKYNSNYSGMRISIYWAPNTSAFVTGEGVIQLGETIDISKTNPWYKVEFYTDYSIFEYMNNDNFGKGISYKSKASAVEPYTWVGYGDGSEVQNILNKMPDVWTGTKKQWDNWFEGPIDDVTKEKTYENIPEIARLCGAEISSEQFKKGELDIFGYKKTGVYKIFFEPVIYPIVDGKCMAMTLRDLIRWEEAFARNDISTSDGKDLIDWITPVFVFTANSQFLIENEPAICMYGKNSRDYTNAYLKTDIPQFLSNASIADTYKVIYDSSDLETRRAQRARIKEQLDPFGGIIYNSMGVGVITPQLEADFDIIYNSEIATDQTVEINTPSQEQHRIFLSHKLLNGVYTDNDISKIEYFVLDPNVTPTDIATAPLTPSITHYEPLKNPDPSMWIDAATGAGNKVTIGMKIYFNDGKVYPDSSGQTYEDKYVIHHITLKNLHIDPVEHINTGNISTVIKAAPRDNEPFEVTDGIPSGESLYVQIIADSYLYRLNIEPVSGTYTTSTTETYTDDEGKPKSKTVTYSYPYTYYEIKSFELYGIKDAKVKNDVFDGGEIILTPSSSYSMPKVEITHDPDDQYTYHVVGTMPGFAPIIRHDKLVINGRVIMDPEIGLISYNLAPTQTGRDVLYVSSLKIPEKVKNGLYTSSGTITYQKVYSFNPQNPDILTFDLGDINPVFVHTPVCVGLNVSDDAAHNQKPDPAENASSLILGRPFTVNISNSGTHRNIKGYHTRDYTKYIKDREIRFGFDTYLGTDRSGTYLKAGTWHSLKSLGISNSESNITFYTPSWVDEGLYDVDVRNIAYNDTVMSTENRANLNHNNTVAETSMKVEVSGRVYDFAITDITDISWEMFFRKAPGSPEATGKVFYTGPNNINGDLDHRKNYFMPVMPGKNDVKGYKDRAVKLGYSIKFEIKTIGNYYDQDDYVRIIPAFAFVDKNGKNRQEVDLYYSTATDPLVKVGGPKDTLTHSMILDFKYRGINPDDFKKTAEAIYRLRGGMGTFTFEKWAEEFPKVAQSGALTYTNTKVLLSEPVRTFIGPTQNIPSGVNPDKALASAQKWYGEYRLPSDILVVPKGTDLSKEKNLTRNSPVFLKDGYVIVNFRDIAVINGEDFDNPSLMYTGKTGDGWALEGYDINQGGWQLLTGDVVAFYADRRATDDFMGTGTH